MSPPSLVDLTDFEVWLRTTFTEEQETWAQAVLEAASTKVRSFTGQTWTTDDELDADIPETVTTVVKLVARRAWDNPTGVVQTTTGPFSKSYAGDVAQIVYLTASDEEMLRSEPVVNRPALFTQSTTRGDLETRSVLDPPFPLAEDFPRDAAGAPMPWASLLDQDGR